MSRTVYCSTCQLPRVLEPQEETAGEAYCVHCGARLNLGTQAKARPATILWIDDDRLMLGTCVEALKAAGYRTLAAPDGPIGIAIAQREHPDVILLDVVMPTMTGFEVCEQLRADPKLTQTPIVLLTALEPQGMRSMGEKVGATTTLRKPFRVEQLVMFLDKLLGRPSAPPRPRT